MPYILIRHKVNDYTTWKSGFDDHGGARRAAGSQGGYVLRNADDPNEVLILLEVDDLNRARAFAASDELREKMQEAGVADQPDLFFLEEADRVNA